MNYVRNAWYVAHWSHELKRADPYAIRILNEPIVIWRLADGTVAAIEDRCVHRHAPLSLGRCEADHLRCMYHGFLYDAAGRVVQIPGQEQIPGHANVKRYPVIERHGWIWVWMGDRPAEDSLLPDMIGFNDENFFLGHDRLDYDAEARLINDNLLDFSHLPYVHAASFQATDLWVRIKPKVTALERGVRIDRWLPGDLDTITGDRIDRWERYDFLLPGILILESANFHPGDAESFRHERPDMARCKDGWMLANQAITPMTDRTARYWYFTGPHRASGDEAYRDILVEFTNRAFAEDKRMIEAQQRIIDLKPDAPILPTALDRASLIYNRLVARTVRAESEALPSRVSSASEAESS